MHGLIPVHGLALRLGINIACTPQSSDADSLLGYLRATDERFKFMKLFTVQTPTSAALFLSCTDMAHVPEAPWTDFQPEEQTRVYCTGSCTPGLSCGCFPKSLLPCPQHFSPTHFPSPASQVRSFKLLRVHFIVSLTSQTSSTPPQFRFVPHS